MQLAYREGKLEKVTTASDAEYRYAYGENGRITEVENARRVTAVKNTYDRRSASSARNPGRRDDGVFL